MNAKWKMEYMRGQPAYRNGKLFISRRYKTGYLGGGRQRSEMFFVLEHESVAGFIGKYKTLRNAKKAAELYPA